MTENNDPTVISELVQQPAPPDTTTSDILDSTFACLANTRRRRLIEVLAETSGPIAVGELADAISEREGDSTADGRADNTSSETAVALHHVHLPKLSEAEVIDVDHATVRKGNHFDATISILGDL